MYKRQSIYNTEITPVYGQQILTLSTCYGYNQDDRILVLAVQNEKEAYDMGLFKSKPKVLTPEHAEEIYTNDFFDMILPSTIKFFTDYYIVGDSYRSGETGK